MYTSEIRMDCNLLDDIVHRARLFARQFFNARATPSS